MKPELLKTVFGVEAEKFIQSHPFGQADVCVVVNNTSRKKRTITEQNWSNARAFQADSELFLILKIPMLIFNQPA